MLGKIPKWYRFFFFWERTLEDLFNEGGLYLPIPPLSRCSIVQWNIVSHQTWRGNIFIHFYLISNDGHGAVHINASGFKSKWPAKYLLQHLTHSISHQVARNCGFLFRQYMHRWELKMQFMFSLDCKVCDELTQLLQILAMLRIDRRLF